MAKLERKTQKIFCSNAGNDQITAFGTAKTASPLYTTDIDAIQTATFLQGWTPSLMSDLAPYLQDSNGLWYAITRQLAYVYQEGIPEYDVNTEYSNTSIVKQISGNDVKLFHSKQNGNIGRTLDDRNYWEEYNLTKILSDINALGGRITTNTNSINAINQKPQINARYIKQMYRYYTSGYIVFSDGCCVQWGRCSFPNDGRANPVYLLKDYGNVEYNLQLSACGGSSNDTVKYWNVGYAGKYNNYFTCWANTGYFTYRDWFTVGYLPEGTY